MDTGAVLMRYETPDHDYALRLALETLQEMRADNASLHRNLYQAEINLAEQERLTEQARAWATQLEAELHALHEQMGTDRAQTL